MMRQYRLVLAIILALAALMACKPGLLPTEEGGKPKVTLERIEIQSYFPWVDLPARTPLELAYIFNIDNPSGQNVKLDNFKFTTYLEATPGEYLMVTTPTTYERTYFPPQTTSQYRVVNLLDSYTINLSLAVANAQKMQELKLNRAETIKNWYTKIQDFGFGIKVAEGMAVFSSDSGDIFVPFEGVFPKK
jgi:hypothetical protein